MVDVVEGGLGAVKGGAKGFFGGGILGGATGLVLGAVAAIAVVALVASGIGLITGGWAAGVAAIQGASVAGAVGAIKAGALAVGAFFGSIGTFLSTTLGPYGIAGIIGGTVGAVALGSAGAFGGTVGGGLSGGAKGFFKKDAVSPELQAQLEHEREMNAQKMKLAQQLNQRAQMAGGFNNPDAKGGNVDRVMGGPEMVAPGMKRG